MTDDAHKSGSVGCDDEPGNAAGSHGGIGGRSRSVDDPYRIGRERYAVMYPENPERWNTLTDKQKQAWCWVPAEAVERKSEDNE